MAARVNFTVELTLAATDRDVGDVSLSSPDRLFILRDSQRVGWSLPITVSPISPSPLRGIVNDSGALHLPSHPCSYHNPIEQCRQSN
jgi:hypothetical protein